MDFLTKTRTNVTNKLKILNSILSTKVLTIQLPKSGPWIRLAPRQPVADAECDMEDHYLPPTTDSTSTTSPSDSDSESSLSDFSPPSSRFTLTPATWTPQESSTPYNPPASPALPASPAPTPSPPRSSELDEFEMADLANSFFTGKPEDQDPQDFMNKLERIILIKTGLTDVEKVRFFELSLKAKSPAAAWYLTLTTPDKASFSALRTAFELQWPPKPITEKTTAEKQALLDGTILKLTDLGKRVAASVGAEEELSHVVWADKVERLAGDIPDINNLLVASTRKKLLKPLLKLISLKLMTWKGFADTVRAITLEELMEKVEDERDQLAHYSLAVPNTPSKALGAAFQNINLMPQLQHAAPTSQYQSQHTQPMP